MRVLLYNVTARGKITSFAVKDMPVSFALPFGAQKKKKEEEESNESRRTVGSSTSTTENHREQRQETVGTAFGKIWECYCAFRSPLFFLSLL